MSDLVYAREDLLAEHAYARTHEVNGQRLHGGFDEEGRYISPRSLVRPKAIQAWTDAFKQQGGLLFEEDPRLMTGPRMPNIAQWKMLLRNGFGRFFWHRLTLIAQVEGRGRLMAAWRFPDLQQVIHEDISHMAIGHWNKGLLLAHGLDEGGDVVNRIGGHEAMWLAARDLAFGERSWRALGGNSGARRVAPKEVSESVLPKEHESLLRYVMNLFMAECRADAGFSASQAVLECGDLFDGRAEEARLAATIVRRIQQDEGLHMASMRLYLSEMRAVTFKAADGSDMPGAELIDLTWGRMVNWTLIERRRQEFKDQRDEIRAALLADDRGHILVEEFDALADTCDWDDLPEEAAVLSA